jgi:hypothetical protein
MFTVSNSMDQLFTWFYYGALMALTDFEKYMGDMGIEVFDNVYAKALIQFFLLLAWGLWAIGSVVALARNGADSQNGGGNWKNTGLNIGKGLLAVNLFTTVPVNLFAFSVQMQNVVTQIFNKAGLSSDLSSQQQAAATSPMAGLLNIPLSIFNGMIQNDPVLSVVGSLTGTIGASNQQHVPTFATILFLIVFLISFLKVVFDNLKRGAILLVQICVCALYMFSVPCGFTDGFMGWCKQIAGICFTTFLQNIFLIVGLGALKSNLVFGLGVMMAAAEIPRIAQSFGLETGFKANITSTVMATNSLMSMGKTLMKLGGT